MLCPQITSSLQEPMDVEEEEPEQEEIQEDGDNLKALSCIDRVRIWFIFLL